MKIRSTTILEAMLVAADQDRYIIGQHNAKRSVAIALRNR